MTKPEAVAEAIRRVDAGDSVTQFVIRRGDKYDVEPGTQPTRTGWKVAEMIKSTNVHAYRPRS